MKFPRGTSIIGGTLTGLLIGLLTDNVISFLFLGAMFGLIGEGTSNNKTTE